MVNATPLTLCHQERHGTPRIGGWVGSRVGLDGCRKSRPHCDSIHGPSSPQRVAIPPTLPQSTVCNIIMNFVCITHYAV